jgi:hypothetical protein
MRTSLCWLAIAFALGACKGDKAAPPAAGSVGSAGSGGSGGSASAPGSAAAAAPGPVDLFVNDAAVGTIQPAQIAAWTRLDTLVPGDVRKLGTWQKVALTGATPAEVARPSSSFPDMVPAVFPGDGGAPAFGMFDPVELARKGKPAMHADHITAIRIQVATGGNRGQNDDGGGAAADPTKLVVTVKTAAGTTTLTGEKLLGLPREATPGNPDQKGWRLTALLDAAGVKSYAHLVLSDASGTNLTLERADLSDTSVPFIKLNKQGALRLRVFKKEGNGWNAAGDLRALTAIDVK